MRNLPDWKGIYPALTTQYHGDESLDLDATARHLDALIRAGIHGVIVLGTVGENCSHSFQEKLDVIECAVHAAAGRIPVLTGVAEFTTPTACRFAEAAAKAHVDGLMVLPPMVYKGDARETHAHFRGIARATDLPIMIYNNPVAYGTDITPVEFAELADEPTLVAIKESSENPRRITDIYNHCGDHYIVFAGVDDLILESVVLGATGWVSGLANAFPQESVRMWELALAGHWEEARNIYRWYTPLLHLDTHPKLVQYIKLCVEELGYGSETVRSPRHILVGTERERIVNLIRSAVATRPMQPVRTE